MKERRIGNYVTTTHSRDLRFNKVKIGGKEEKDVLINFTAFEKARKNYGDKNFILKAIANKELAKMGEISEFYYDTSGIYQRICQYLAFLYKYDWFIVPKYEEDVNVKKMVGSFDKASTYLENSNLKRMFGQISLEVLRRGAYYGCLLYFDDKFTIQQLPNQYCRSRFMKGTEPIVELDLRFFDDYFTNTQYRSKILKMFPAEVQADYAKFKNNKLPLDMPGDTPGWTVLDPAYGIKLNFSGSDTPALINVIPSIIDLDAAQELDRKKTMQQLLKIIVQKLPLDKNGDLIFDNDESYQIHQNAVNMLSHAVGADVLTTFADMETIDMQDKRATSTADDLQRVERTVYNNSGTSQNLFNTTGSTALEKSIANDEAKMRDLLYQYRRLLNKVLQRFKGPKYSLVGEILETTIYNYKDLAKTYKEQTTIGFSKLLPQIALGQSQSSLIAIAKFENEILDLNSIMIPPLSSNTMSSQTQQSMKNGGEDKSAGRDELPDDQKSDKTLQNLESIG